MESEWEEFLSGVEKEIDVEAKLNGIKGARGRGTNGRAVGRRGRLGERTGKEKVKECDVETRWGREDWLNVT